MSLPPRRSPSPRRPRPFGFAASPFASPRNGLERRQTAPLRALLLGLAGCLAICLAWPAPSASADETAGNQAATNEPAVKAKQPNIVFIFTDDHALQAIGAYGSKVNQTPHLDRLASQGLIFDRSYCANSICGPSRACVLTGKHSHINGFMRNDNVFDGDQPTFPKQLQAAGYQTAIIGKWHLVSQPQGFDHWEILPGQGHYYNPVFLQMDGSRQRYNGYCPDLVTDLALDWVENRAPNRPFLLMAQHKAPHRNWAPHPRHFGRYPLGSIAEPDTLFDDYAGRSQLLQENEMTIARHFYWSHDMKFKGENRYPEHFLGGIPNGEYARMTDGQKSLWDAYYEPENQAFLKKMDAGLLSDKEITQWKYQRYMHDYLGCVAAVDDSVGRILDYLDDHGLAENTIVVYASDQGFYLGEHGWYDKRWIFEESLRMPLIVRWPAVVQPGQRSAALVQNIDYAPTFLQAAGAEVAAEIQGTSLLPILQASGQPPADWRQAVYYAYYENDAVHAVPVHDGIRSDRYKLVFFPRTSEFNLFDLESDPQEMTSVHDSPEYQSVMEAMRTQYVALKQQYEVNPATIPTSRGDEDWWKQRDQAKRQQAKQGDVDLLFLGDSITQGWEGAGKDVWQEYFGDVKTLNLGFSGDRTEHLLWRLTRNQLGNNQPQAAVMLIGTNNTGHRMQAPAEVAAGVEAAVAALKEKSPETKLLLLAIFPRGTDANDPMRKNNDQINQLISQLDDGQSVFYRDINQVFLEADGTLSTEVMPDQLHLSDEGYRRWAAAIAPTLRQWGVLPPAERPRLKDLNGHFPFTVPESLEQWQQRAEELSLQTKIALGLYPMPALAEPAPVIHGRQLMDGYTVEKVFFESVPGHYVTGTLFRPSGTNANRGKRPAVMYAHGHWDRGRFFAASRAQVRSALASGQERFVNAAVNPMQAACVQLARMGCVVFQYDMVGYADSEQVSFERGHRWGIAPHFNPPVQDGWLFFSPTAEAYGQSIMGLQTINTLQAFEMLSRLDDVDPQKIVITGGSGGGTQSFIGAAMEPRFAGAFPAVMVSTSMQGGCTCENACGLRVDTGNVELAALIAPRPLTMTTADDWTIDMPTDGYPQLQQLYEMMGKKQNVGLFTAAHFPHNYNHVSRTAMYNWVNQLFELGWEQPVLERDFQLLTRSDLTVWDEQHPRPAGGVEAEADFLKRWAAQIDAATKPDHRDPDDLRAIKRQQLHAGWSSLTAAADGWHGHALHNARLRRLSPASADQTAVVDSAAVAELRLTTSSTPPVPNELALPRGLAPAAGTWTLSITDPVTGLSDPAAPLVQNPRPTAAYTYGYNAAPLIRRLGVLVDVLTEVQAERQRPIRLVADDSEIALALLAAAHAPDLVAEVLWCTGSNPAVFDPFAAADSIQSPAFLANSARFQGFSGLQQVVGDRLRVHAIAAD